MTLLTKVLGGCCACLFYFATLSLSAQEAVSDTITGKVHQIEGQRNNLRDSIFKHII